MKKVLLCGMLLGLLTSVSFAQRGRMIGAGPTARMPTPSMPATPIMHPNAVDSTHGMPANATVPANATTVDKNPNTNPSRPTAVGDPTAKTVSPDADRLPSTTEPAVRIPNATDH
jgi:hypothetical protein